MIYIWLLCKSGNKQKLIRKNTSQTWQTPNVTPCGPAALSQMTLAAWQEAFSSQQSWRLRPLGCGLRIDQIHSNTKQHDKQGTETSLIPTSNYGPTRSCRFQFKDSSSYFEGRFSSGPSVLVAEILWPFYIELCKTPKQKPAPVQTADPETEKNMNKKTHLPAHSLSTHQPSRLLVTRLRRIAITFSVGNQDLGS